MVFQENLGSKSLALKAEFMVKRMSKARKEKLVEATGYAIKIASRSKRSHFERS